MTIFMVERACYRGPLCWRPITFDLDPRRAERLKDDRELLDPEARWRVMPYNRGKK